MIRIAIIGSNAPDASRDTVVEELGYRLVEEGYGVVTGGIGGVMAAVARGAMRSAYWTPSSVLGLLPDFAEHSKENPWTHDVIHTEIGSMRNELILRACHAAVACGGGAGTLSEIALAWQRQLPLTVLNDTGGWSSQLAGMTLDDRYAQPIESRTIEETLEWLESIFPFGCFSFRQSSWYSIEVPCFHRIHGCETFHLGQSIQNELGLSTAEYAFEQFVRSLNQEVEDWNYQMGRKTKALITFDDGYRDVINVNYLFQALPNLQPVVFIPDQLLHEPSRAPLPMHRLYAYMESNELTFSQLPSYLQRNEFKTLAVTEQHRLLDQVGAPTYELMEQYLSDDELARLAKSGWLIGSHGPNHHDLRAEAYSCDESGYRTVEQRLRAYAGSCPWIAWPEGWYDDAAIKTSRKGGFSLNFTIDGHRGSNVETHTVHRIIRG